MSPSRSATGRPHWLGWAILVVMLVAVGIRGSSPLLGGGGDLTRYIEVGELVLHGQDIYATSEQYTTTWPPLFALIVVPLALLARHSVLLTQVFWAGAILLSVVGSLSICIRLVYGRPLVLRHRHGAISVASAAAVVPTLLALRSILENFLWLQVNSLVLWLALAGCWMVARSRPVPGGALIGAAAALKVIPIFFVPYFIWKRWWRALGAMLLSGAALTVLPMAVFGIERWWSYVSRFLGGSSTETFIGTGSQSLYSMFHRILVLHAWWDEELLIPYREAMDTRVLIAVLAILLVLTVMFILVSRRGGDRPSSPAVVTEFAAVIGAAILFLPFAWRHYFVFLLPAYVILWRVAATPVGVGAGDPYSLEKRPRRRIRVLLTAAVLLQVVVSTSILGDSVGTALKHYSNYTMSAVLILAALLYFRWILGRRSCADLSPLPADPPQSTTSSVTTSQ